MAEDEDFITMFIDDGEIAGQLSHANICQNLRARERSGTPFHAMEYVQGKDVLQIQIVLGACASRCPCPWQRISARRCVKASTTPIASSTKNNQPLNIIHRDVSPQNVLVTYEGRGEESSTLASQKP